jgi:hypothetical protein
MCYLYFLTYRRSNVTKNIRREDWESLKPTIHGWGVVDVNYNTGVTVTIQGKSKLVWTYPYYADWRSMIRRCFGNDPSGSCSSYVGCEIFKEWQYLSNFIKWVDSQPNRDWKNSQLDKDLLGNGKLYSPETCVYISCKINTFMLDSKRSRGSLLIGVCFHSGASKENPYASKCSNPFTNKTEYISLFPTELEAHLAWKAKKHEHALKLADLQDDPRVAEALRTRYL